MICSGKLKKNCSHSVQSPPTVCDNVCQPSNLQRFHCLGFREDGNCLDGRLLLLIDMSFKPIFLQTLEFLLVNSCTAEKCFSWFCFSSILKRNILSWFFIESSVQCCKEIFSRFVIDFFCGFYARLTPFRALSFQSSALWSNCNLWNPVHCSIHKHCQRYCNASL